MTRDRTSEASKDQGHGQAQNSDKTPHCVRCGREMPGYRYLYGLCQTCVEIEHEANKQLLRDLQSGKIPYIDPKYRPNSAAHRKGERASTADAAGEDSGPSPATLPDEWPF